MKDTEESQLLLMTRRPAEHGLVMVALLWDQRTHRGSHEKLGHLSWSQRESSEETGHVGVDPDPDNSTTTFPTARQQRCSKQRRTDQNLQRWKTSIRIRSIKRADGDELGGWRNTVLTCCSFLNMCQCCSESESQCTVCLHVWTCGSAAARDPAGCELCLPEFCSLNNNPGFHLSIFYIKKKKQQPLIKHLVWSLVHVLHVSTEAGFGP